jgi:hypothetical protein
MTGRNGGLVIEVIEIAFVFRSKGPRLARPTNTLAIPWT